MCCHAGLYGKVKVNVPYPYWGVGGVLMSRLFMAIEPVGRSDRLVACVVGTAFQLKRSYSTPGPVSTAMGDCLQAGKPSRCEACQLGRLSLLPSVGR